ncbi:MAG: ABC transporter substrate-binding protein [Gammaproteobacteria bacterium]
MKLRILWAILLSFLITNVALAQDPVPLAMLKQTSSQMLSALKQNRPQLKGNTALVHRIVVKILLPHVDLDSMSRAVVGRSYWSQATPAQQSQFKKEFTDTVIRTYATAISSYDEEQIKFYPIRGFSPGQTQAQVRSDIIRKNGQVIPVSYRLILKNGQWLVYDFSVEGVSLVQSYQSQFAGVLSQSGFNGLLARLKQHNQSRR